MVDPLSILNELLEIVGSARQVLLPIGFLLVVAGLLFAFFGRKIFEFLLFLIGGSLIAGSLMIFFSRAGLPLMILLGILGFVFGGLLTVFLFYGLIFAVGASIGALVGFFLFGGGNFWADIGILVVGFIFGALAIIIFQLMLAISTAVTGGYVVAVGTFIVTGDRELSTVLGIVTPVIGAFFQIFLLEAFAESVEKATGNTFERLLLKLPFKSPRRKSILKRKPTTKEVIKNFSIEENERLFLDAEEKRRTLQISEDTFEKTAKKVLDRFNNLLQAYDSQLATLAKKTKTKKRLGQINSITRRRENVKQVMKKLENILERWREKNIQSYIS